MGLLNVIRRLALRAQASMREIARRTGLSRITIKNDLKAGTVEPEYVVPERPSKLDPFADKLAAWLKTETAKSRKQRRTLSKRVSPTCLIRFERNRYSVPASFANRPVSLRVCPDRLAVVLKARLWRDAAEGQILCEHQRLIQRSHHLPNRTIHDWRHYLAVIQSKPGALRNGAPLRSCRPASGASRSTCCDAPVATGRWSISWWASLRLPCA